MMRYNSHCLRPIFTEMVVQALFNGTSINLIASPGQGGTRLLEDIQKSKLKNTKILFIDMKIYQEHYENFIQELQRQLNCPKEEKLTQLNEIVIKLEETHYHTIFILHHFDELLDNLKIDNRFDLDFFNNLTEIINQPHMSLLCVTRESHDQCTLYIHGEKYSPSWIHLEKKKLPKLSLDEIQFELKTYKLSLSAKEIIQVAWAIHGHVQAYDLLKDLANKIAHQEDKPLDLSLRLKIWVQQFNEKNNILIES